MKEAQEQKSILSTGIVLSCIFLILLLLRSTANTYWDRHCLCNTCSSRYICRQKRRK